MKGGDQKRMWMPGMGQGVFANKAHFKLESGIPWKISENNLKEWLIMITHF